MPDAAAQGDRPGRLTEPPGPEPTLPELYRRAGPAGRIAAALAGLVVVAVVAWLVLGGGGSFSYDGPDAPPFSLGRGDLEDAAAGPGELLALEGGAERLSVEPLGFESRAADREALPELALAARPAAAEIARDHPGARIALEGRTLLAVDHGPEAYQLAFTAPAPDGDGIVVGKRYLVPDPDRPGEGVTIEITERTARRAVLEKVTESPASFFSNWPIQLFLEDAAAVRTSDAFEEPLRSFSFD